MSRTSEEPEEFPAGPEFEVWNHLEEGLFMAREDMRSQLPSEVMDLYERIARLLVDAKSELHLNLDDAALATRIRNGLPELVPGTERELITALLRLHGKGQNPWLKHAIELELGGQGVWRAQVALERFNELAPVLGRRPLPEAARPYLREVVDTYLFGFDAACIALCRSTLEQLSRDAVVRLGLFTEGELRRKAKPISLETLLEKLKQADALDQSFAAAVRLRERGNEVVHRHLYEERIRRKIAADSITDLLAVLGELVR